jgi:hypothetical protein
MIVKKCGYEDKTMNRNLMFAGLLGFAICLGGCLVIVDEETNEPGRPERSSRNNASHNDGVIAEIDAVGKLTFDSDREQGHKRIAARKGLSVRGQTHLVEAVFSKLSFDNAKVEVLLTLIANPGFSRAAERTILEKIDKLAFPISKKTVLKAISDRKEQS